MEQQYPSLQGFEVADDQNRQEVAPPKKLRREKGRRSVIWDYVETIFIALLMAVILRVFLVSAYRVSSGSMEDTLLAGDYIFVSKLAYEMSPPKLGDVIVFENPYDPTRDYIKRIVAAEGQTVEIWDKVVYIDGDVATIPENAKHIDRDIIQGVLSPRDNFGPLVVPAGQYFVMGDNRDDSRDSRFWGCIDKSHIKGKALFIYFSYEPDPAAPRWKAPYILEFFQILWHNANTFFQRFRPERIGHAL